jgi:Phage portal protein
MTIEKLGITPEESQFPQTRVPQRDDIAAIFRVPVHLVGSEQKLSNANVEQINLSFIVDTLRPNPVTLTCGLYEGRQSVFVFCRERAANRWFEWIE